MIISLVAQGFYLTMFEPGCLDLKSIRPFSISTSLNSCSIFYYILYIGNDNILLLLKFNCLFTYKQTVYESKI